MTSNQSQTTISQPVNFSFLSQESKEKVNKNLEKVLEIQEKLKNKLASLTDKQLPHASLVEAISKMDFAQLLKNPNKPIELPVLKTRPPKSLIADNIKTIYIDCHHLIFLDKTIRQLAINFKKQEAMKNLAKITQAYSNLNKKYNIIMLYNETKIDSKSVIESESTEMKVQNTAGVYKTSTDAIIDWATKQSIDVQNSLFVSSDKDLQARLSAVSGVESINVIVPAKWQRLMQSTIGKEQYAALLAEN